MSIHPNHLQQLADIESAKVDRAHLEALALNVRHDIEAALAKAPGFELDVDTWGDGGIVLRHFPNTKFDTFKYDYEIPLEG